MNQEDLKLAQKKDGKTPVEDPKKKQLPKLMRKPTRIFKPVKNKILTTKTSDKEEQSIKSKQTKVAVKQGEQIQEKMEERNKEEEQCYLCERHRPVFVAETDDMIKRLPERFLSGFLKSLKKDFIEKRQYLKFLRISVKFIKACKCENKETH